ncbi:hypothetical protein J6590_092043 [Homalodisca vitripennis]|nr:hypothetical protein J6590_083889 [Homalodisca vitripennis]KAG8334371.1 hypothetical protein J6590_092043 [Homalodisca vitripennis]
MHVDYASIDKVVVGFFSVQIHEERLQALYLGPVNLEGPNRSKWAGRIRLSLSGQSGQSYRSSRAVNISTFEVIDVSPMKEQTASKKITLKVFNRLSSLDDSDRDLNINQIVKRVPIGNVVQGQKCLELDRFWNTLQVPRTLCVPNSRPAPITADVTTLDPPPGPSANIASPD